MQFFINPVNIVILYNSTPTFHSKSVLLITYIPDNILKKLLLIHRVRLPSICIRRGNEYSVPFVRLQFYQTSSLCLKSMITTSC